MYRTLLLSLAALSLSACTWHHKKPTIRFSPDIDAATACPNWRWIGVKENPEAACPVPEGAGWKVQPLFEPRLFLETEYPAEIPANNTESGDVSPQEILAAVPPGLRPYCVYEHIERGNAQDIPGLIGHGLQQADSDCAAVGKLGDELLPHFEKNFRFHAGATAIGTSLVARNPHGNVRLAFLDTQPTSEMAPEIPGRSLHGYALAHVARNLVCPDQGGACAARITTQLAMPIVSFDRADPRMTVRDEARGGFFGTLGDLASAIRLEVEAWQDSGQARLILNLSLGWEGRLFGDLADHDQLTEAAKTTLWEKGNKKPKDRTPPTRASVAAVHAALQDAACRGALIVAAAGNHTGGPLPNSGPMLPAGWQQLDAPDAATCAAIVGTGEVAESVREATVARPLVYAASGVRSEGSPLANTRQASESPLAAYADHVSVPDLAGQSTTPLTGTSVAAAVISATAAALWHHDPQRPPHEVMDLMHWAGDDLSRTASFHHPSEHRDHPGATHPEAVQRDRVRRVSLCSTMRKCSNVWGSCPAPAACPKWSRQPPSLTTFMSAKTSSNTIAAQQLDGDLGKVSPCSADNIFYPTSGSLPANPCPFEQFHAADAVTWTHPQPGVDPCPTCISTLGSPTFKLFITIDQNWRGGLLHDATLNIGKTKYHLGLGPLAPGDTVILKEITDPKLKHMMNIARPNGTDVPVYVSYRVDFGGKSVAVQSPVFFAP